MKKIISLSMVLTFGMLLSACGSSKDAAKSQESTNSSHPIKNEKKAAKKKIPKTVTSSDFVKSADEASFDGKVLKGNTYTIKITDHKILQPGEAENKNGQNPIIAFWYDTLVAPDYDNAVPLNPIVTWKLNFEATQKTDQNATEPLKAAILSDNKYQASENVDVKPGNIVSNIIAYELTDAKTPVTLTAASMGTVFGETEFAIK
ncbi:DUF5067 domain-containing protein [Melissococcus plutonius]|uniref:DUF5067 domain-containing protein n=1 Tax=Melissococcus plutonius TaxID=33970 RepID=A0A2Z5Y2J3_9ENTE|nr:DUF5067 domain-containing protein [Melissococcus plutonius]MCV2497906.1 DUF5067 domain-containing protein [Melissococcus plutonius]MCV2500487.1 DUF5067 domain-containing protein [Melissococcus plutonius]MCV2505246.1 DUF5067 domain-containing protein [Melissococcus plutonius]MCV2506521.1 DUF5067 domain-containing protein [Melissococcus plutonius]MCV2519156.1 DUF5067 domain-containing protein [Melissococcus plutonius]